MLFWGAVGVLAAFGIIRAEAQQPCPGYRASNVQTTSAGLSADLELAGTACNSYGTDLPNLRLTVEYQTDARLHVKIDDQNQTVYQVPESVFPRPTASNGTANASQLKFTYSEDPFSFAVSRASGEVLFNTSGSPLVFESQYLNLRTSLPQDPFLYGLGEHTDPFRLNTTNYTRTIWTRDAYGVSPGTNLYGDHPIYLEHRGANGSHGVILVNSNGMDIKINDTDGQYLEYNTIGGVFDFYFVAGPSPTEVAQQIASVVGYPAMIPYAGLGYHNCRYGYQDVYQVAEVVHNYSVANIPLETMWTDIDYMDRRSSFSLDPQRFPLSKMRELVDYLHAHQQHYVVMVDPAIVYRNYTPFENGRDMDVFMKVSNGSIYQSVVWGGVSAYPDWFHPSTQAYWTGEFDTFFNKDTGVDIDFLWIDMNEPSNFCTYPCSDPAAFAEENNDPPEPPAVRDGPAIPLPEFPSDFQPNTTVGARRRAKRQTASTAPMSGLAGRNLIDPPYRINNAAGSLSNLTANTDIVLNNGLVEYDTHNLYGTMMSNASRNAMESRRPGVRPLIITRSTFMGAGSYVGHWLGDNLSDWPHYRTSIAQMLQFTSIFQVPMVGADVCGFGGNTTEDLCARWMMLGAFTPFYRNHNNIDSIPQEPYRWPAVTAAAQYAIDIRYRMLDYLYTALYTQSTTGRPAIQPLFYVYPADRNTFGIQDQFFFGDSVLVSPVVMENATTVTFYLPQGIFYDWNNGLKPVVGNASNMTLSEVGFQTIPLHVRGGSVLPLRAESANTTTELRKNPFSVVIAPDSTGAATGSLYVDEGSLLEQPRTTLVNMTFSNHTFALTGRYDYPVNVSIESVLLLGVAAPPASVTLAGGQHPPFTYNASTQVVSIAVNWSLTADTQMTIDAMFVNGTGSVPLVGAGTGRCATWAPTTLVTAAFVVLLFFV